MRTKRQDFILGLFVLAALGVFAGSILFIYPSVGGDTRRIMVRFAHDEGVAPLKPASAVLLSGAVQVGKVQRVAREHVTVERGGRRVDQLMIVVEADVARDLPLYQNCRITTDQPPVGGPGVMVILSIGTPESGEAGQTPIQGLPAQSLAASIGGLSRFLLAPGGFLEKLDRAVDPAVEGSLLSRLVVSLEDVNAITAALRTQFDSGDSMTLLGKVRQMADNLSETTAALRRQMSSEDRAAMLGKLLAALDRVNTGLAEATELIQENRPGLRRTVEHVESFSAALEQELASALRVELNRDDPQSLLGKVHGGMDRLSESLDALAAMTDAGRRIVVLNKPVIDETIRHVREISETLKLATDEIRLAPWRLFYRPSGRETREMSIFEAARTFAEAADNLRQAAARLEALQEATAPAEEVEALRAALRSAFERFRTAEDFLFERLK